MELRGFFHQCPQAALGFSGGVDSAYLLYAALENGAQVRPYFVKTAFQPQFELEDARRLCAQLGVELTVLELDILAVPRVGENPPDRCDFCKRALFGALRERALAEGFVGTDDSSLVERAGGTVLCVQSPRDNLKVTVPEDLRPVTAILLGRMSDAESAQDTGMFPRLP